MHACKWAMRVPVMAPSIDGVIYISENDNVVLCFYLLSMVRMIENINSNIS